MNHKHLVALANGITAVRPDWQQPGILSQLSILDANWTKSDAALAAHAMAIAASPSAKTPAAFNVTRPADIPDPTPDEPLEREPRCYTCGDPRSKCEKRQDWEIEHGLPDPHVFETEQDAEENTAPRSAAQRALLREQIRTLIKRVPDLPHVPEDAKAEASHEGG